MQKAVQTLISMNKNLDMKKSIKHNYFLLNFPVAQALVS